MKSILLLLVFLYTGTAALAQTPFSWDNATVYFVMTDRFEDGNATNNNSYGRGLDGNGTPYTFNASGHFHGGDLAGLTQQINAGYFDDLGVNAIWVTAFYEQIHGWVGGGNGDFQHYPYHGYYALDQTNLDANMGTTAELQTFVDAAHAHGIRVVLDVVLNHAGYNALHDMDAYSFGNITDTAWKSWRPGAGEDWHSYHTNFIDYATAGDWPDWWGTDWIRAGLPGYTPCGGDDITGCLAGLPDYKTEVGNIIPAGAAGLPPVLVTKWTAEGRLAAELAELDAFYTRTGLPRTPRNHLIKWLTDWVRDFGIDGYRVDTAKHVELSAWQALKDEAVLALAEWKAANPTLALDDLPFWMTAEVFGHGPNRSTYHDNGFDSVINFAFQAQAGDPLAMEPVYAGYAASINTDPTFNILTYISSHDTHLFDRANLIEAGTSLLMLPGGVQIYYGDETARPNGPATSDAQQATRSPMNWGSEDPTVLSHWQKLGQFRNAHLAVGAGQHQQLSAAPYTFKRTYSQGGVQDRVVVVFGASALTSATIDVSSVWPDGVTLTDFYTGNTAEVSGGQVAFTPHANGVLLIEGPPPVGNVPTLTIQSPDLPGGETYSATPIDIEIIATDVEDATLTIHYTTDGTPANQESPVYTGPFQITTSTDVQALVEDSDGNVASAAEYYTIGPGLVVHFKKPDAWAAAYLHYFNAQPSGGATTWPGVAMTDEGCDWYAYTIPGASEAGMVFNANASPQTVDLFRDREGWFTPVLPTEGHWDGTWSDVDPDGPCVPGDDPPQLNVSPPSGTSPVPIQVTMTATDDNDPSVAIYYTLDGTTPSEASTLYTGPFTVSTTTTVKAIAYDDQNQQSAIVTRDYAIGAQNLVVHVKRPNGWGLPRIHYWGTVPDIGSPTWPSEPMVHEGCGWYRFEFPGAHTSNLLFNGFPAAGTPQTVDLLNRATEGWFTPTPPAGGNWTGTWSDTYPDAPCTDAVDLSVRVLLQGAYTGGAMRTALQDNSLLPNNQPYRDGAYDGAAMEYNGLETSNSTGPGTDAEVTDWALVELRTGTDPVGALAVQAGLLTDTGLIVDPQTLGPLTFAVPPGDYYVVTRQRNHLPLMSAAPVALDAGSAYTFFTGLGQAYGSNPMVEVGLGLYAAWAGDGDRNGSVSAFDFLNVWLPENGGPLAYTHADFNLDGSATAFDFLTAWLPANGQASQVP